MVILAGLHVVSRDFSDVFPCLGIRVIHKISVIILKGKISDAVPCNVFPSIQQTLATENSKLKNMT